MLAKKPASPGHERAPGICLQGHLDMVCEKSPAVTHDFSKDPIDLVRHGKVLMASGTTLGADNGIGVATNLAVMDDRSLAHGPLELLFTVDSLAQARVEHTDGYPAWTPKLDSPILRMATQTLTSLHQRTPDVKAVHAGLECGIAGETYPGIDMVSFGPTLEGVHSPDEKIHVDAVQRFWAFLLALLERAAA